MPTYASACAVCLLKETDLKQYSWRELFFSAYGSFPKTNFCSAATTAMVVALVVSSSFAAILGRSSRIDQDLVLLNLRQGLSSLSSRRVQTGACCVVAAFAAVSQVALTRSKGNPEMKAQSFYAHCRNAQVLEIRHSHRRASAGACAVCTPQTPLCVLVRLLCVRSW